MTSTNSDSDSVSSSSEFEPTVDILPECCDVPWREGFRVGSGFNSLTGAISTTAVDMSVTRTVRFSAAREKKSFIHIICQDLDVVHSVTPTVREITLPSLEPLGLRAWSMARAIALVEPLEYSVSFLLWYYQETQYVGPCRRSLVPITPRPRALWTRDRAQFREKYGDYYVAYTNSGREHSALVTLVFADEKHRSKLLTELAGVFPSDSTRADNLHTATVLDDSIAKRIDRLVRLPSSAPIRLSLRSFERTSTYEYETREEVIDMPRRTDVFAALLEQWSTSLPRTLTARLYHYAGKLGAGYVVRSVPLKPSALAEQMDLQVALERCSVAAAALPERLIHDPLVTAMRDKQRYAVAECLAERTSLSTSPSYGALPRRRRWIQRFQGIEQEINNFLAIYKFWQELVQKRSEEPMQTIDAGSASSRLYGVERTLIRTINVRSERIRIQSRTPISFPSSRSRVVNLDAPIGTYIIGWRVESVNGLGSWRCDSDAIILEQEAQFVVWPGIAQSSIWRITLFYAEHEYLDLFAKHFGRELD